MPTQVFRSAHSSNPATALLLAAAVSVLAVEALDQGETTSAIVGQATNASGQLFRGRVARLSRAGPPLTAEQVAVGAEASSHRLTNVLVEPAFKFASPLRKLQTII